jgi:hypothetical protein
MNKYYRIIFNLLAAAIFMACEIDNYDPPEGGLYGRIVDRETGEAVPQPAPSDLGLRLRFYETGKENSMEQHFYSQIDGSYKNTRLFNGPIRLVLEQTNFFPLDTLELVIQGQTEKNIEVIPYIRIEMEKIRLSDPETDNNAETPASVTVEFTLSRDKKQLYERCKIAQYHLLWHASPYIDNQTVNYTGKISEFVLERPDETLLNDRHSMSLNLADETNRELLEKVARMVKGNGNQIYIRLCVITLEADDHASSVFTSNCLYANYSQVYPVKIPVNLP